MNLSRFSHFPNWEDAYDTCRERDCPLDVSVIDEDCMIYARIYPSGAYKTLAITLTKEMSNE